MNNLRNTLLLVACLAASLASAEKVPAGFSAAADTQLVKNVKNYLMPVILK
jgi:hypothetical protein